MGSEAGVREWAEKGGWWPAKLCACWVCSSESAESGILEHYHKNTYRRPCSPVNR